LEVAENNETARIKMIPRLDYGAKNAEGDKKRRSAIRPPQRFFNPKDVDRSDRSLSRSNRGYWIWGNETFDKNGFLEREIKINSLDTENIQPTLEEIAKFSSAVGEQADGLSMGGQMNMLALAEARPPTDDAEDANRFQLGDLVSIIEGELINAQGIVKSVTPQSVTLQMKDEALGEIMIEPKRITKAFQVGDHVRVFRGKFKDERGMITQVQGDVVTLFSDTSLQQFSVFLRDIQSVGEISVQDTQSSAYAMHDFVQIG
jgi:transcription elongation factor SPT5